MSPHLGKIALGLLLVSLLPAWCHPRPRTTALQIYQTTLGVPTERVLNYTPDKKYPLVLIAGPAYDLWYKPTIEWRNRGIPTLSQESMPEPVAGTRAGERAAFEVGGQWFQCNTDRLLTGKECGAMIEFDGHLWSVMFSRSSLRQAPEIVKRATDELISWKAAPIGAR